MASITSIKIEAPAKINLVLEVTGKRKDGYHNIRTIFQSISLCDILTLREIKKGIRLSITPYTLHLTRNFNNLAFKAASIFLRESGIKKGIDIHIKKNIPVGAGLGGGSSDAASVLVGLNRLWRVGFRENELKKMTIKIGMDVPFFIEGGRAYATGRGEIIQKISPHPSFWIILIDPGFSVSTKWAYENVDNLLLTKSHSYAKIMLNAIKEKDIDKIANSLFNTFEELIRKKYSNFLEDTKYKLIESGAIGALMTGSGPAVFGIVERRGDAYRVYKRMKKVMKKVYLAETAGG